MKPYDLEYMKAALEQARTAALVDEVPVGAVLVYENKILAARHNQPITLKDPCAHAEILTLRDAAMQLGNYRLNNAILYVTLEPCPMCVYAMIHARIKRCIFGAHDPKTGALGGAMQLEAFPLNHRLEVEGGVLEVECAAILRQFFGAKRGNGSSSLSV